MFKEFICAVALGASIFVLTGADAQPQGQLVTETYTVRAGDTLDDISYRYMAKSGMPRDVREFRQGVIELNFDEVFAGRTPGAIFPGDHLKINYWVKK